MHGTPFSEGWSNLRHHYRLYLQGLVLNVPCKSDCVFCVIHWETQGNLNLEMAAYHYKQYVCTGTRMSCYSKNGRLHGMLLT